MDIAGCQGHDTSEHPAEQPARENGDKTAWIIGHLYIHRCTTADATWKETDPSLRSFIDFPLLSLGIYIKQCHCQLSEDNKLSCEGNSLSYFKFVRETLTHSGLRKVLESNPSSWVTSSISSPTPSSILVISERIRSKHISIFKRNCYQTPISIKNLSFLKYKFI